MTINSKKELDWEAFRYVAGEMTADECDGFELLLTESQEAREAVAEAVELTQAVKVSLQSEPVTPAKSHRFDGASSWWLGAAMGSAACLLIVLGWQQATEPQGEMALEESTKQTPDDQKHKDGALAARWSEVRERDGDRWGELSVDDPFADWDASDSLNDETNAAPEWMMAAVSEAQKNQSMGDDMDMERSVDGPIEQ